MAQPASPSLRPSRQAERTWAEIDSSALAANAAALRAHAGRDVGLIAVVKANAYGHGLEHVVPALASRVEMFAVANLAEAKEVRALTATTPILLLSPVLPDERAEAITLGFIPMISSVEEAAAFSALSRTDRTPVHLKLDTGMGRAGLWHEEAAAAVRELHGLHGIEITGIASHLPVADEDETFTRKQLAIFHRTAAHLRDEEGLHRAKIHVCNSAGLIGFPELAGDLARVGLALYGSSPLADFQSKLQPVMEWKTRVTLVRETPAGRSVSYGRTFTTPRTMRLATLAAGYADGVRRHLSGRNAEVLIRGQRCPIVGRVTMDQIIADVSALSACDPGDEATLMGRAILAAELAEKSGTIAWEIFTGLGSRVHRLAKPST